MALFDINKYIEEQGSEEPVSSIMRPNTQAEEPDTMMDFYKRFSKGIYDAFPDKEKFKETFVKQRKTGINWDEVRRYTREADMQDAIQSSIEQALGIMPQQQEEEPEQPQGLTLVDVTDTDEGRLSNEAPLQELMSDITEEKITREELPPAAEDAPVAAVEAADDTTNQSVSESESQGLMSRGPRTRGKAGDPNKAQKSIEGGEVFNARDTQRMLNELGDTRVAVDGAFGPNSRKALGKYQASIGLPATGIMDRATLEAMRTGTEAGDIEGMDFQQDTVQGRALAAVEELTFNPYILNRQARLRNSQGERTVRHNSGLTIGTGFDLGSKSKQSLLDMGVSEELATKLDKSGWLGVRPSNIVEGEQDYFRTAGHAAMVRKYEEQANNGTLLTLSPEEIDELVQAEYDYHEGELEKAYEDSGYGSWDDVSQNAKIALTVERYHKGNLGSNWRTYFERARDDDVRGITDLYLYRDRRQNPVLRALGVI